MLSRSHCRLQPGDLLCLDNYRVFHGREPTPGMTASCTSCGPGPTWPSGCPVLMTCSPPAARRGWPCRPFRKPILLLHVEGGCGVGERSARRAVRRGPNSNRGHQMAPG
ncbi:MAG: TauD/TfdA family dioxygenase [Pseudonocardiales bacterium]|nr:TauD/TfdA family dioxygenase [Pseudonocardiales bacterium]